MQKKKAKYKSNMENSKPKTYRAWTGARNRSKEQLTENNDWARSEWNTETKYTDTNDMTRNR